VLAVASEPSAEPKILRRVTGTLGHHVLLVRSNQSGSSGDGNVQLLVQQAVTVKADLAGDA